jgi:hypothetical protein
MKIEKKNFENVVPDNEEVFISRLLGIIESIDELCFVEINKLPTSYHFRIAPSTPQYAQPMLSEILGFNNLFGIKLDLSKSIKINSTLSFKIYLN